MKYSCAIIISHFESENFLYACIKSIRKYRNDLIGYYIIVADQSGDETNKEISEYYKYVADVTIVRMLPLWSGFGLDWILRNMDIKTDYICQIHTDVLAINKNFLYLPIKLIEENNFSFVGQLQFISDGKPNITYPPNPFFAMAQCFNVAKTETYLEMSEQAGFTRFHNRPESGLTFKNNDWADWAKPDYNARGSDDDVVAFCWEDNHREHDKLGLAITGYIEPNFGRIIDDLVFHFGSANEARGVMEKMSPMYQIFTEEINRDYSDKLIDYMVSLAKKNRPPEMEILNRNYWNGKTKTHSPPSEQLNKRIEELKI